jgi:hypothetical protein
MEENGMRYLVMVLAVVVVFAAIPALGASSYLGGMSGLIYTPDDVITPTNNWELSYHNSFNEIDGNTDLQAWGLQYGVVKNLEIGLSYFPEAGDRTAFNGKYRLVKETATAPNVTIGVLDAFNTLNEGNGDPDAFILVSKNLTPFASGLYGAPSKPVRATLGLGTGIYRTVFGSLDWTFMPRVSLMAEYVPNYVGQYNNTVNVGVRYAATDMIRLDAAAIDFREFALGVSVRGSFR